MKRACIFDLDGTLLNTLRTVQHYCNQSLHHFGFSRIITEEECRSLCRLSINDFYTGLLRLGGCPEKKIEQYLRPISEYDIATYEENATYLTEPFPGVLPLLSTLKSRSVRLAILTNKPAQMAIPLVNHFFPQMFDRLEGQTLHTIPKPDPRSLLFLLDELNIPKEEAIYVGDTDVDMKTAKAANVFLAAVGWGYQPKEVLLSYQPEAFLEDPASLLSYF